MKKKILTIKEYDLPVVIDEQDAGFVATCPVWKDCFAQGDTIDEALNEIGLVASSLIELYKEEDMEIPLKLKKTFRKSSTRISFTVPVVVTQ